jgi:haloalkane dehalogenase
MQVLDVLDSHVAYRDLGAGARTVVFLHGNPTSSYLWRDVLPHVTGQARCVAPDLIGMGDSGKPAIGYRFADHARYLDAFLDRLGLSEPVLVGHDWGGVLALDWAARHPDRIAGIVLLETFLRPLTWAMYPPGPAEHFRKLRAPGTGERMVLDENWFLDFALRATSPDISEETLAVYNAPYPTRESRLPMLQWPREISIDGEPADVTARVEAYGDWLAGSPAVPKLLLTIAAQGLFIPEVRQWCADHATALEIEDIGPAGHQAPEDQPDAIGRAVADWLTRHGLS